MMTFNYDRSRKFLKLINPHELLTCEGSKLMFYQLHKGYYDDIFLRAECTNHNEFIYIKVKKVALLSYFNNEIALQQLLFSCPSTTFLYCTRTKRINIELPISLLDHYTVEYSENKLSDLPKETLNSKNINFLREVLGPPDVDPYGEEDWFENSQIIERIQINACMFIRDTNIK